MEREREKVGRRREGRELKERFEKELKKKILADEKYREFL